MKNLKYTIIMLLLNVLVIFFLIQTAGHGEDRSNALARVKRAIARTSYQYGEPAIYDNVSNLTYDFLPRYVMKHTYWKDQQKKYPIRTDYYRVPTLWNRLFRRDLYLATKIYIYNEDNSISYLIWLNRDNEIQRFTHRIPLTRTRRDAKTHSELYREEAVDYDKDGVMTKRTVWSYQVDHDEREARYTEDVFDAKNVKVSSNSGDWNYADFYHMR